MDGVGIQLLEPEEYTDLWESSSVKDPNLTGEEWNKRYNESMIGSFGVDLTRMKARRFLVWMVLAMSMVGCVHRKGAAPSELEGGAEARPASKELLSNTYAAPGSVYMVKVYVVQRGDTFTRIANSFGMSVSELRRLNPGLVNSRISIGQQLRVGEERGADLER